jgi:hypothetical protein
LESGENRRELAGVGKTSAVEVVGKGRTESLHRLRKKRKRKRERNVGGASLPELKPQSKSGFEKRVEIGKMGEAGKFER